MDFNFLIGGAAGQGIQSVGKILLMTLAKGGYYVFANQDYESRVRGGHNFFKIRVSDKPIITTSKKVNLIIALNIETIHLHKDELIKNGLILFEGKVGKTDSNRSTIINVPFKRIAIEKAGNKIMANTVAIGAALGLVKYDFNILSSVLKRTFGKKSRAIAENNIKGTIASSSSL